MGDGFLQLRCVLQDLTHALSQLSQYEANGSGACEAFLICEIVKAHAERPVKQQQRIVTINQERLRYRIPRELDRLTELLLHRCRFKGLQRIRSRAYPFCDSYDFVEKAASLILNNAPIVSERSEPEPLVFRTTAFEEQVAVGANHRDHAGGGGRAKRRPLANFDRYTRPLVAFIGAER